MSGYRDCACRDCFEIAIGEAGAFCNGCEASDCDLDSECQAPHAYCEADSEFVSDGDNCAVCGQPF